MQWSSTGYGIEIRDISAVSLSSSLLRPCHTSSRSELIVVLPKWSVSLPTTISAKRLGRLGRFEGDERKDKKERES